MASVHYLISAAGIPNYGDDVIAAGWLRHLARTAPGDEVVLDCVGPEVARAALGRLHPRVRFTDTLWRLARTGSPGPAEAVDRVDRVVSAPGADADPGLRTLLGADAVHLLGGGYVNGLCTRHLGLVAGAGAAVRRSGGLAALTGVGLWPPFEDDGEALRRAVEPFAVLDVRDEASAACLRREDVRVSCDDLFLDLGDHLYRQDPLPEVMLCAQTTELLDYMEKVAGAWGVPEEAIGFMECDPTDDHEVFTEAVRRLPGARFFTYESLLAEGFPAAPGQTWITSRFHPHLVAAAAGAHGIALDHGPAGYYSVKHRSLADGGSGWRVLTDREVPARPRGGGYPAPLLAGYRDVKQRLAEEIHG